MASHTLFFFFNTWDLLILVPLFYFFSILLLFFFIFFLLFFFFSHVSLIIHDAERSTSNMKLGVFSYQFFLRFSPSVGAEAFWWMEWMHVVRSS